MPSLNLHGVRLAPQRDVGGARRQRERIMFTFFSLRFSSGLKNFGIFFVPVAQWKSVSLTRRRPRVRSEKDETLAGNTFFCRAEQRGSRDAPADPFSALFWFVGARRRTKRSSDATTARQQVLTVIFKVPPEAEDAQRIVMRPISRRETVSSRPSWP